jgi:N-acetylmuramoyl-L-alanine amidase
MRKVYTVVAACAAIPVSLSLMSCGTNYQSGVTSVRSPSYYEVYDSRGVLTNSGYGAHPYAKTKTGADTHTGTSFAGRPQYEYPLVKEGASSASAPAPRSEVQLVTTRNTTARKSPTSLLAEAKVRKDFISTSAKGRRLSRSFTPSYITIHSTQNWSSGADAWRHSLALKNSKLGKLSWHFTVDESVAVQHLPTTITGNHADFDGPGNRTSIGIEMCEHPGNSRNATVERTAKLAAYLMYKYDIPLSKVVPHYHWPRHGMSPAHKNCPHFLLDNGRPGPKWRAFQIKVKSYYDDITSGGSVYVSR